MRASDKLSAVGCGVAIALFLGLFVAVWGVGQTGDCWNNCVAGEDTVISFWPLGIWGAGVAISWAGACAYEWARSLSRTDTPTKRWASATTASAMSLALVLIMAAVIR